VPPFRLNTANEAFGGIVTLPELTTTASVAVGTAEGFQLFGLSQSPSPATPVHVIVFAAFTVTVAQLLVTAPKALATITRNCAPESLKERGAVVYVGPIASGISALLRCHW